MPTTYVRGEKSEIIVSLQPQKATNKSLSHYLMLSSVVQCLTSTLLQDFNKNQTLSQNTSQGITTPKRDAHGIVVCLICIYILPVNVKNVGIRFNTLRFVLEFLNCLVVCEIFSKCTV